MDDQNNSSYARAPKITKELLIKMKDTIRPTDKVDVDFLKYRIEEEKKKK